ncbi:MAG TPA: hypothetical protein PKA29_02465 [Candidatus Saccharibacteria bacterium]|nr:hypothetical protein [Candidatus Saccharibacteria bacterium]
MQEGIIGFKDVVVECLYCLSWGILNQVQDDGQGSLFGHPELDSGSP